MTQPKGWDSEHLGRIQRYSRPSTGTDRPLRDDHLVDTEGISLPFYGQNGVVTKVVDYDENEWSELSHRLSYHMPCTAIVFSPKKHLHTCKIKLSHRAPDTL